VAEEGESGRLPSDLDAIRRVFWDTSVSYRVQSPLTDEMLEAAERTLAVKLPRSYVDLLRVQNGGCTSSEFTAFPTPQATSWAEDHVPFDDVAGIAPANSTDRSLLDNAYYLEEWGIPEGLILLSGDGHWWIALDYRRSGPQGEPNVLWFDTELGESLELARNFDDFVRRLRPAALFEDEQPDLDHPPGTGYGTAALCGAIKGLQSDIEQLQAGRRSLANTKAWCAQRAAGALELLPPSTTADLSAALLSVETVKDKDAVAGAITAVIRELDALIPDWIEAKGPGYGADYAYLYERGEADRARPPTP
jgi:hypothetical protein